MFLADRETGRIDELYAALDSGAGDEPVKLSEILVADGRVIDYAVSHDRTKVAYLASQEVARKYELYVVPVDPAAAGYRTGAAWKVSGAPGDDADVRDFSWSPDGGQIAFLADRDTDEADELYVVDADGNNLHKVSGSIGSVVEIGEFAWSADSQYVGYLGGDAPPALFLLVTRLGLRRAARREAAALPAEPAVELP